MFFLSSGTGAPSDFDSESHCVIFEPRSSRQCVYFNIIDDSIVEDKEYFNVTLGRTADMDDRVQLRRTSTTIYINDNDGMMLATHCYLVFATRNLLVIAGATVRLDPLVTVNTEGRSVELCAIVESAITGCRIEYDFNITFDIRGTAGI